MPGEFDLIERYIAQAAGQRADVELGIGDDCALLQVPAGQQLAVSMDTLVCGRHFVAEVDPQALGHKALAVNLSDLAAMGAQPAWVTLSLTLPEADETWLAAFMQGFRSLAQQHQLQLVGGDTTRGPLSITVQVHGFVEPARALRRSGAHAGDLLYVSGQLGDAGLALMAAQGMYVRDGSLSGLRERLDRPMPRVALGRAAVGLASAAIDLSDGLSSDLNHLCAASGVAAQIQLADLPLSDAVADYVQETGDWSVPLASGDDYELLLAVPAERQGTFEEMLSDMDVPVSCIGWLQAGSGVQAIYPDGQTLDALSGGYDHFKN